MDSPNTWMAIAASDPDAQRFELTNTLYPNIHSYSIKKEPDSMTNNLIFSRRRVWWIAQCGDAVLQAVVELNFHSHRLRRGGRRMCAGMRGDAGPVAVLSASLELWFTPYIPAL